MQLVRAVRNDESSLSQPPASPCIQQMLMEAFVFFQFPQSLWQSFVFLKDTQMLKGSASFCCGDL